MDETRAKNLLSAAYELAELVDDKVMFIEELQDAISYASDTGNFSLVERLLDNWEGRTVSSNDMMLGNVFPYNENTLVD